MQQDKQHIENKLRQLENQQLPDLSNMDKHWQEMQQLLDNESKRIGYGSLRGAGFNVKRLLIAASLTGIGIFIFLMLRNNQNPNAFSVNQSIATKETPGINNNSIASVSNSTVAPVNSNSTNIVSTTNNSTNIQPAVSKNNGNRNVVNNFANNNTATTTALHKNNGTEKIPLLSSEHTLASFYNIIQKNEQSFTIDGSTGARIQCNEGTAMMIPPAAFTDKYGRKISGSVTFTVKEFYKYSDIVTAHLTTTSGGKQLVTGGMLHITAQAGGNALELSHDKAIEITMPTNNYDPRMQLFTSGSEKEMVKTMGDSLNTTFVHDRFIDWKLAGSQTAAPVFDGKTNFYFPGVNLSFLLLEKKKNGKYRMPRQAPITTKRVKEAVKKKYGDNYEVIDVIRDGQHYRIQGRGTIDNAPVVDDSIRLTLAEALSKNIIAPEESAYYAKKIRKDSAHFINKMFAQLAAGEMNKLFGKKLQSHDELLFKDYPIDTVGLDKAYIDFIAAQKKYSFTVQTMGWINCDRFAAYPNITQLIINLPEGLNASDFVSQLVFKNIRSVMPGYAINNQIVFNNIPKDMEVYLVGLGEKDGRMVSFYEKIKAGEQPHPVKELVETTPAEFREKLKLLD